MTRLVVLPRGWAEARLGEVAEVKLGKMLSPKAFAANLMMRPYLRNENVRWGSIDLRDVKEMGFRPEEVARHSVEPGDLLACEGGEPGRCAVYSGPPATYSYQKALHRIRPIQGVLSSHYLAYWLRHQFLSGELIPRIAQTTIQHLPLERFVQVPVALPPPPEQMRMIEAIDAYLSRLDEAEALLDRAQRNLKRYRAAVLQTAVEGRLVPTEAELARAEGRDYEPADVLLKRILADRRRRWEESELAGMKASGSQAKDDPWKTSYRESLPPNTGDLPALPNGWCWTTLDQLAYEVRYGTSTKTVADVQDGVAVLRMGNIADGALDFADVKYLPADHAEFPQLLLAPGDLLFNRTNSAGLVGKTQSSVDTQGPAPSLPISSAFASSERSRPNTWPAISTLQPDDAGLLQLCRNRSDRQTSTGQSCDHARYRCPLGLSRIESWKRWNAAYQPEPEPWISSTETRCDVPASAKAS